MKSRYKFLKLKRKKIVSGFNEDFKWKVGEWYKIKGDLSMCSNGFHCSAKPLDAMGYVSGEILAIVEVRGKSKTQSDKQCWSEMRIAKAYKWTKKDSITLSIYSAELVIKNYEKEYPDDDRPRKAIEAAKKVLEKDTAKNRDAARSAGSAARSAARSAEFAAWSAGSAALNNINKWIVNHIKELDEMKD